MNDILVSMEEFHEATIKSLAMSAAIQRVRELHQPIFEPIMESQIGVHWCSGCDEVYPCSTIKALDGEQ